jgi:peptidoglycan/xylan/chitin deacetylase (PgdA/CDA1 family)
MNKRWFAVIGSQSSSASSEWNPANISGLVMDVDPSRSVYQDDAGATPATADGHLVGRLVEQVGGNAFVQATAEKKPTLKTGANGMNGKPVLQFAGAQILRAADFLTGQTGTMFFVFKPNLLDNYRILFATSDEAGTLYRWQLASCLNSTEKRWNISQRANTAQDSFGSAALTSGNSYIGCLRSDNIQYQVRTNGTLDFPFYAVGGTNTGDWFTDTPNRDNVTIGGLKHTSETFFYSGDLARILLYDRALTSAEILTVEAQLASLYGVTVATDLTDYSIILVTFDDSHESVYNKVFAYMQTKGMAGTVYETSGTIETRAEDITWAQLVEMDTAGWDIGNHTKDHYELEYYDLATQTAQIADCTNALIAHGLTRAAYHFAYPKSSFNANTEIALANIGILTARDALSDGVFEIDNPPAMYHLGMFTKWDNTSTAADEWSGILNNLYNKVLICYGHRVYDTPGAEPLAMATAEFNALMDLIAASPLRQMTITELYEILIA